MTTTATWTWSGCSGWKGSWPKWGWRARRWARSSLWPKVALPQLSCLHKHRELKSLFSVLKVGHAPYKKFRTDKCSGKKTIHPKSVTFILSSSVKSLSHVRLFATPWTVAYQAPRSLEFSRQEYWSGLPFPSSGCLPDPVIEPGSLALQADALPLSLQGSPIIF